MLINGYEVKYWIWRETYAQRSNTTPIWTDLIHFMAMNLTGYRKHLPENNHTPYLMHNLLLLLNDYEIINFEEVYNSVKKATPINLKALSLAHIHNILPLHRQPYAIILVQK